MKKTQTQKTNYIVKQREEDFKTFLDHNFGEHITDFLLNKNTLSINQGSSENLYHGNLDLNKKQILKLVNQNYKETIEKEDWAFDFPGWLGSLDFKKDNVKDILVIGMEPHIGKGNRTAQVTYGLRETEDNQYSELGEHIGNRRLWNNLNSVFNNNDDYYHKEKYSNNQIDNDFFNRIYITDLAHFAIKGKAKEANITNWKNIREKNANQYISETIKLIRPKYIVSQGKDVSNFINKLFQNKENISPEWNNATFSDSKYPYFKHFKLNDNNIVHIILPHLASGNTNSFWLPKQKELRDPKMNDLRNQLNEFEKFAFKTI